VKPTDAWPRRSLTTLMLMPAISSWLACVWREAVQPDHRYTGLLDEPAERLADGVGLQRLAEVGGEDMVTGYGGHTEAEVALALLGPVLLERDHRRRVEVERASAAAGLRDAHHLDAVDDGHRLIHGQAAPAEVDVGPTEADELAAAHAGSAHYAGLTFLPLSSQKQWRIAANRGHSR
jgi:hypothetical protein